MSYLIKILYQRFQLRALILIVMLLFAAALELFGLSLAVPLLARVLSDAKSSPFDAYLPRPIENWLSETGSYELLLALALLFGLKSVYLSFVSIRQTYLIYAIENYLSKLIFKIYLFNDEISSETKLSDLANAIIKIPTNICNSVITGLLVIGTEGIIILSIGGYLLVIDPVSTLAISIMFGSFAIAFVTLLKPRIHRWGNSRLAFEHKSIIDAQDVIGAARDIRLYGCQEYFRRRFNENVDQSTAAAAKFNSVLSLPRYWIEYLIIIGLVSFVAISLYFDNSGRHSLEILGIYVFAGLRLLPSFSRILGASASIRFGIPYISALKEALSNAQTESISIIHANAPQVCVQQTVTKGQWIEISDLSFSYSSRPVLSGCNLSIRGVGIIGLRGESGSGKSTFISLLMGLRKPTSGQITFNGVDIWADIYTWRAQIGCVNQFTYIMDRSLAENVAFGIALSQIDLRRLTLAIERAELTNLVNLLPDGLSTKLGEAGSKLSGGEIQRIGIARALYRNPKIVILDEATSSLDKETEEKILNTIRDISKNTIVLMITHNPDHKKYCSVNWEIDEGKIYT